MKKVQFFIDDVIWVMRDLTRQSPESMFDNPFLGALKKAHEEYGVKTQLNLFYRTSFFYGDDDFSLKDMTDAYKSEWESASDWLKLAFHSKEEFPDYPYVNASYELVKSNFEHIAGEIKRFAGEKSIALGVVPHWEAMSMEGVKALVDSGIKIMFTTFGDKIDPEGKADTLPYGHGTRLILNKKPETALFHRITLDTAISNGICSHNHLTCEQYDAINSNDKTITDEKTGMKFKCCHDFTLNLCDMKTLLETLDRLISKDYINIANHEQYFYPDYFNYQPDYFERLHKMCEILKNAGYRFIFMEELA